MIDHLQLIKIYKVTYSIVQKAKQETLDTTESILLHLF